MATKYGTNGSDYINGTSKNDKLYGKAGDDSLYGKAGNDYLDGGDGYDYLIGDKGKDKLSGGYGDDYLFGGKDNDKLTGDYGYDYLVGGSGADKFVFNSPWEGVDTIEDFSYSQGDKIQIDAYGFGINPGDYHYFSFNSSDGSLSFNGTQFASLQPSSGFVPSYDITIV